MFRTGISGVTFDKAWGGGKTGTISGIVATIISWENLIQFKHAGNRPKDRGDIELLERTKP